MTALANRYHIVFLFDVTNGNRTAILTPATCRAWTPRQTRD